MFLSRIALHYDYIATAAHEEAREEREEATYAAAAADLLGGFSSSEEEDDEDGELKEEEEEAGSRAPSPWKDGPAAAKPQPQAESRGCGAALAHVVDTVGVPSGSRWQDIGVAYLLLGLLAFFCAGLATPCFAFAYEGLAGWILSHVTEHWPDVSSPVKESTVVSLGLGVPAATDVPDSFGTRYLQAAFLFFVVGAPLGCLALLLALTLLPVRVAGKLLTAAEVLYAWSAPDVLFVSMVTTTLEIQNFVNFVLGDRCDGLNAVLRVVFDKVRHGLVGVHVYESIRQPLNPPPVHHPTLHRSSTATTSASTWWPPWRAASGSTAPRPSSSLRWPRSSSGTCSGPTPRTSPRSAASTGGGGRRSSGSGRSGGGGGGRRGAGGFGMCCLDGRGRRRRPRPVCARRRCRCWWRRGRKGSWRRRRWRSARRGHR